MTSFSSDLFSLLINFSDKETKIVMKVLEDILYTSDLPHTCGTLKKYLPSIFKSECFNDKNLPFKHELHNTEVGHLFEHIILAYLCQIHKTGLAGKTEFTGLTDWNWKKDTKGTFHITIDLGDPYQDILSKALRKSIKLLNAILPAQAGLPNKHTTPVPRPAGQLVGCSQVRLGCSCDYSQV